MVGGDEKARRKEILRRLRDQQRQKVQAGFPAPALILKNLFDFLDEELSANECDHTLRLTREFIRKNSMNEDRVVQWLEENGGYCDCEALENVESVVSDVVRGYDDLGHPPRRVN